jgi:hypothetical protein
MQHLNELNQKKAEERTGTVTIEELGQAPDEKASTPQGGKGSN